MSGGINKDRKRQRKDRERARRRRLREQRRRVGGDSAIEAAIAGDEFGLFTYEIDPADVGSFELYLRAHQLLPFDYSYRPGIDDREVERAVAALDRPDIAENELLRAIVILGHSPCRRSLEALGRLATGRGLRASLARHALGECAGMAGQIDRLRTEARMS
jgi:hypothetical protein